MNKVKKSCQSRAHFVDFSRFLHCAFLLLAWWCLPGSSFNLRCHRFESDAWAVIGRVNKTCWANMTITEPEQSMTSVTDSDQLPEIFGFYIRGQEVLYVPKFYDQIEERLKMLYIVWCELEVITRSELERFPNLSSLSFEKNNLKLLDSDLFEVVPKLEYLNLSENKLKVVGQDILWPLKGLKIVWFAVSHCINQIAENPSKIPALQDEMNWNCRKIDDAPKLRKASECCNLKS